jgi:transporter family-2 protein
MIMFRRSADWLLAVSGGLLLALMINYNSLLAKHTSPMFASWVAHGLGAIVAFALVVATSRLVRLKAGVDDETRRQPGKRTQRQPLWFYLGGIPGAATVVLAAITVNSSLSLSGTIAFMLVGQALFGIVSDHFGLFRTPKRRIVPADFLVTFTVLAGSTLILFGGA